MRSDDLTRRFETHGVALAWDEWGGAGVSGSGHRPLLLCHGFSGSAHDFAPRIGALSRDRTVVALDDRGHGRSTKTHDGATYSVEQLTADLISLIEARVDHPIHLLGHSMGGAIAIRVTLARPELVRSLIMMDTSAWSFRPTDAAVAQFIQDFLAGYDPADGLPDLGVLNPEEEAMIASATPQAWQAAKQALSESFDPYALKALGEQLFFGDMSVRARLGDLTCPVTVITGERDVPFIDQADEFAASVKDGLAVTIEGAFHSPQLTHADAWLAAVDGHLERAGS